MRITKLNIEKVGIESNLKNRKKNTVINRKI